MSILPVWELRNEIVESINNGNRLIIRAPTGSGKSTQVPSMLLSSGTLSGQILVLQPRRLAARMLAARVAFERKTELGAEIGFQTRFESSFSELTRVRFITEGILPRLMLTDPDLSSVSAVIFDEFHERSLTVDMGLALIRSLQERARPDLKLIVMSATLEVNPLSEYLAGAKIITTNGRSFPVEIQYYPECSKKDIWAAAAEIAVYLVKQGLPGDILVFMPGIYEIRKTVSALREAHFGEPVQVMMLYGDMSAEMQKNVMEGIEKRKIIIATNIAETSLTIPGVRMVIDSGLSRVNRYDSARGFNMLYVEKVSTDSADQRTGRAGREDVGTCVRLWSMADQRGRASRTQPEILRVDLAEMLLQLKMLGFIDIAKFPWFEKPLESSVIAGLKVLENTGAITSDGELTYDGNNMAKLPMHPRLARLLIESEKRGVVRQGAFAAAVLSEKPVFMGSPDFPDDMIALSGGSDFTLVKLLIDKVIESDFDYEVCRKLNVNIAAIKQIIRTEAFFLQMCRKRKMHTRDLSDNPELLSQAILLAYADRLAKRRDQGTLICDMSNGCRGELAKESMARGATFLVVTTVRELKSQHQTTPKTVLSFCCRIREEWLREFFQSQYKEQTEFTWNSIRQAVEEKKQTICAGIVINEKIEMNPEIEKASGVLADAIVDKKLPLAGWNSEVQEYLSRAQWLSPYFPDLELTKLTDYDYRLVVHELCRNQFRYDKVKDKPVINFVKELFSYEQQRAIETLAPSYICSPSGRKWRIIYKADVAPLIRARIQELYDLRTTPRIANNMVAVVMEILAPNNRPVQITDDLEGFWRVHYPELKKTLSRRYPKHEWR